MQPQEWQSSRDLASGSAIAALQQIKTIDQQFRSRIEPAYRELERSQAQYQISPQEWAVFAQFYQQTSNLLNTWNQTVLQKNAASAHCLLSLATSSVNLLSKKEETMSSLAAAPRIGKMRIIRTLRDQFFEFDRLVQEGTVLHDQGLVRLREYERSAQTVQNTIQEVRKKLVSLIERKQTLQQERQAFEVQRQQLQQKLEGLRASSIALAVFTLGIGIVAIKQTEEMTKNVQILLEAKNRELTATERLITFAEQSVDEVNLFLQYLTIVIRRADLHQGTWQLIGGELQGILDLLATLSIDQWALEEVWATWQRFQWEGVAEKTNQYLELVRG